MTQVRLWLAVTLLLSSGVAAAQAPFTQLEDILKLPLSAAQMALLTLHPDAPETVDQWRAGLTHSSREVRAAAARAIYAKGNAGFVPDLAAALESESDRTTAVKLIETITVLDESRDIAPILAASERLGLIDDAAFALAKTRRAEVLTHLEELRARGLRDLSIPDFLRNAVRGRLDRLGPLASAAIREKDAALWRSILEVSSDESRPFDDALLGVAMELNSVEMRADTAWYLFRKNLIVPPPLETHAETSPASEDTQHQLDLDLIRELARRRTGEPANEASDWIQARASSLPTRLSKDSQESLNLLTQAELAALSKMLTGDPTKLEKKPVSPWARQVQRLPQASVATSPTPGLIESLVSLTKCRARKDNVATASLTHGVNGRPIQVRMEPSNRLPKRCRAAVRAFANMIGSNVRVLPATEFTRDVHILFTPKFLACSAAPPPPRFDPVRGVRAVDKPPVLKTKVDPVYTDAAEEDGVQGTVLVKVVISDRGCPSSMEITKSVRPDLDRQALVAVSGWEFEPAEFAGRPVAVQSEISVEFKLLN